MKRNVGTLSLALVLALHCPSRVCGAGTSRQLEPAAETGKELQDGFRRAYEAKDWKTAIELGRKLTAADLHNAVNAFNLACVYSLEGSLDESLRWLNEAGRRGFARLRVVETDSDLAAVRAHAGYEGALSLIRKNREKALVGLRALFEKTVIHVTTPPDYDEDKPVPLIIALHGYGARAEGIAAVWKKTAAQVGALLVAPRAVRPGPGVGKSWTGEDRMSADEAEHLVRWTLEFALREYNIDRKRTVLTGFSQGGFVALAVGPRQPYGFTGVIPMASGYIHALDAPPKPTGDRPPRFYFMVGEMDRPVEEMRRAAADFAEAGYEVEFRIYPGVAHFFPVDRETELLRALEFVLQD